MEVKARPAGAATGGVWSRAITGGHTTTISPDLVCMRTGNTERHPGTACTCVIHTAGARVVHGKWGVRRGLARMMLALRAALRCLALSVCLVLVVWYVCVITASVLPTAPLRRLQRLPRRWERTPWCRCIRWSMQLAACVRVHCACARFVVACLCMRFCPAC